MNEVARKISDNKLRIPEPFNNLDRFNQVFEDLHGGVDDAVDGDEDM